MSSFMKDNMGKKHLLDFFFFFPLNGLLQTNNGNFNGIFCRKGKKT